jgi:hypothetical protein
MPPNDARDALYYFLEDQSHGTARIRNMTDEQHDEVKANLERWLGLPVTGSLSD